MRQTTTDGNNEACTNGVNKVAPIHVRNDEIIQMHEIILNDKDMRY